jgi:hypothetical protein
MWCAGGLNIDTGDVVRAVGLHADTVDVVRAVGLHIDTRNEVMFDLHLVSLTIPL